MTPSLDLPQIESLRESANQEAETLRQELKNAKRQLDEWDKELDRLHVKNGDLDLRNQNLECELAKLAAINPRKSGAIGLGSSEVEAADLLNQLKTKRKKSRAELADVEVVLGLLEQLRAQANHRQTIDKP